MLIWPGGVGVGGDWGGGEYITMKLWDHSIQHLFISIMVEYECAKQSHKIAL